MTIDERHIIRLKTVDPAASPPVTPAPATPGPTSPTVALKFELRSVRRLSRRNVLLIVCAAAALIALLFGSTYFFSHRIKAPKTIPPQMMSDDSSVIDLVRKIMELPDEFPVIAIVGDMAPLKDQAFFRNAKLGDFVLMFPKAAKAILYRKSDNKIIEVAPITQ